MDKDTYFQLLNDILHGDEEHREWLSEAFYAAWEGEPVPPPRGSGTKDRLYREIHRLRDKLEIVEKNPCICDCCQSLKDYLS